MPLGVHKTALFGAGSAPVAEGGVETTYDSGGNTYLVHTFLSSGDLVIGGSDLSTDYVIQAGGGDGCGGYGAGGGGGGQVEGASITLSSSTTYPVVIGPGGPSSDSTFRGDTAVSGGNCDATGGCGGGRSHGYKQWSKPTMGSTQPTSQPSGATGYGTGGGSNASGGGCGPGQGYGGAGGGGGTQNGGSQASGCNGGPGGNARSNVVRTGSAVYYGGGGGGGVVYTQPGGAAGSGGGGAGIGHGSAPQGNPGGTNTGGGAGGGGHSGSGEGGSGIVVIRFIEP